MEAGSNDPGASLPPMLQPKHTIFLSHSGKEKAFVQELNHSLLRVHHSPFFDQNRDSLPVGERFPQLIFEAAKQCRVAVIILSIGYLTSKWPMLELVAFHKSIKAGSPIKLLPVFYSLTPNQLEERLDSFRIDWLNLFSGEEEVDCRDAIHALKGINGLTFEKYGNNIVKFREDVVQEICKLLPRPLPFDTSDIQGYDRLCKQLSDLFKEDKGIYYLGIYGDRGSGKSKLCQAMCNYYNEEYGGKYCYVEIKDEKATDSRAATKKREERLRSAIKQLVGVNKNMSDINSEAQGRKYLKDRVPNQRVFLVVENVSRSSIEEAEFYVNAGYARGSKVLVTSKNKLFLKSIFRGRQYNDFCHPVPVLTAEEAAQLVLKKVAPSREIRELDETEFRIVDYCCSGCFIDKQYHPSSLIALANYLCTVGDDIMAWVPQLESESFHESNESGDMYRYILMDYDNLSNPTKLIFLDLALFSEDMCHTHLDFHPDLEWDEHSNFTNVITYISYLHNLSPKQARTKVKELQGMSFLKESTTKIAVPDFYKDFARWLLEMGDDDRDEKKWCVVCEPEEEATGDGWDRSVKWPDVSAKTTTRVSLIHVSVVDSDLQKLQHFTKLVYLELIQVANMPTLDLQGFSSLRVMKVEECEELLEIICTCNSSSNAQSFCYQNQRPSGCLHNLRVVQLAALPSLKTASFPSHCFNLETLWFFECSNLSSLPNLQFCKKLKRLRLPCGDFKGFQGLSSNVALTELAFHWDPETVRNFTEDMSRQLLQDVMNLTNLTVLDIVDECNVYEWIPPGVVMNVRRLVQLAFLDLSFATTIIEIEGLQELRHLTALGLYGCCELLKLPNLANFAKLKRLCIGHCHKLVETLLEDDLVRYAEFHPWGDYCSFGEHECLHPSDKDGICKVCHPKEWDEINGDQEWDMPSDKWNKPSDEVTGRGNLLQAPEPMQETYPQQIAWIEEGPSYVRTRQDEDEKIVLQQEELERGLLTSSSNVQLQSFAEKSNDQHQSFAEKSGPSTSHPANIAINDVEKTQAIPAFDTATDDINILLLGETGVGKSTFINALCNYLVYPTLREACDGEMQSLIYTEFLICDENDNEVNVVAGTPSKDEHVNTSKGNSSTQKCKAYPFRIGEKRIIRLIDTPGIGDTRGFDQDVKNMKDIRSFISRYDVLNAICIFLKPNETRLTISLKYYIIDLLAYLHKDATSNILFCFTNARTTLFRAGSTKKILEGLLLESTKPASTIKLDRSRMFHFDSEGFRILAAVKNKIKYSDEDFMIFENSWKKSTDEAGRLIQHIASLPPHDIEVTLSLNNVRGMLLSIEKPLVAIFAAIMKNMDEIKKNMKQYTELPLGAVSAAILRTMDENKKNMKQYIDRLIGGNNNYFTGDENVFCQMLSLRSRKCKRFGLNREYHARLSHELKTVVQERVDESLRKVLAEIKHEYEQMKNRTNEEKEKAYKTEMEIVVHATALFSAFLRQNTSHHFAIGEYFIEDIMRMQASDLQARVAELKKAPDDYTRVIEIFRDRSGPSSERDVTIQDVKGELQKLFALPRNGDSLRILVEDQENEQKSTMARADEILVNVPSTYGIRAPGSRFGGGTSLFQNMAINTYKNVEKSK